MNFTSDEEWELVADSGTHVVFTPETELQMGMGYSSTERARAAGLRPTIGADIVSNNSGDMFFPLRLALQSERAIANQRLIDARQVQDGVSVTAREAMKWATVNGAAAAGLGHRTGRLVPGMAADVAIIDGSSIEMSGWAGEDGAAHVALQAHPGLVTTVLVDGIVVKRNRALVADAARVARQVTEAAIRIAERGAELGGFRVPLDQAPSSVAKIL